MSALRHTPHSSAAAEPPRAADLIALTLIQPIIWLLLYGQLFQTRRRLAGLRDDVLHDVPRARGRGDDRVLLGRPGPACG